MTTAPPNQAGPCHVTNQQHPTPTTRTPSTITPMTDTPARKTGAADAGVFVAALVLFFISVAQGWTVLAVLCGVVLLGVCVTTAARRQQEQGDRRPRDGDRPWKP